MPPSPPRRLFGRSTSRPAFQPPAPVVSQEPPAPEDPADDPLFLEGFSRIDGTLRPAQVSAELWSQVFPGDYQRVRQLAGGYYFYGASADAAVLRALEDIKQDSWGRLPALTALAPLFPGACPSEPTASALAASMAVMPTASRNWRAILSAESPERAAFAHRTWHAAHGMCLVCGQTAPGAKTYGGDAICGECYKLMPVIGPVFGGAVVAECRRLEALPPPLPPADNPAVDPDDSSTWSLAEPNDVETDIPTCGAPPPAP